MAPPLLAPDDWTEPRAWRIWIGYALVFVILAIVHAVKGDADRWGVVARDYWPATWRWWGASEDLYTPGIAGFLYLPQSIWLFTPFAYLPFELDHVLWRVAGLALLATGLRRAAWSASDTKGGAVFFLATVLVLLCAFSATNTGQTNLHLAGLLLHACVDVQRARPGRASLWLWIAMAAKPVTLAAILLVFVLDRASRKPLALGALIFAVVPYVHWDWAYVTEQYGLAFEKLRAAGQPGEKVYANLVWLIQSLGLHVPQMVRTALQLGLALGTLGACVWAVRRGGARVGAWFLFALAASYMMLLSPRTETNTYVVLVPWLALVAAGGLVLHRDGRTFVVFAVLCLLLASDNFGRAFHGWTSPWLKPLVAVVFVGWCLWRIRTLPPRTVPSD